MNVFLQVNTSGEEQKHGVAPQDVPALALQIVRECSNLHFRGLMTIGSAASAGDENADFERLAECRVQVARALSVPPASLDLSMGMSQDYEQAVLPLCRHCPLIHVDQAGIHQCSGRQCHIRTPDLQ